jgi:two-component system response regulator
MKARKILLVEDNPDDAELTMLALQENGIGNDVVTARNGEEALAYLFGHAADDQAVDLPALTLLDLKLPKVDGFEVLRRVRADPRTRTTPIVVLTSSKRDQDLVESYGYGANAYVRKPVGFTEFSGAVRALGLFWLIFNEPPPPDDQQTSFSTPHSDS